METIEQNIEKQDLNNFNEISEKICDEINEKVNMIYDEIIKTEIRKGCRFEKLYSGNINAFA